jgi:hypothetical protein
MCNSKHLPGEEFEGRFKGNSDGIAATANLTVRNGRLQGTIVMNGQHADLRGSIDGNDTHGIVQDAETGKEYEYDGSIVDEKLTLSITFPELSDRVVRLIMQRENSSGTKEKERSGGELDPEIVGTWKHTEILGGDHGSESMTNESLMEFREDGTCSSWPGLSSGPGYYREEDKSKASTGKWYTKGNRLYFIDPATREDASTNYSVNENSLLMSNGGSNKKLWQRVQ